MCCECFLGDVTSYIESKTFTVEPVDDEFDIMIASQSAHHNVVVVIYIPVSGFAL